MCDTAACREESGTERTEHASANLAAVPTPPNTSDDGPWLSTVKVGRDCPPREAARSAPLERTHGKDAYANARGAAYERAA